MISLFLSPNRLLSGLQGTGLAAWLAGVQPVERGVSVADFQGELDLVAAVVEGGDRPVGGLAVGARFAHGGDAEGQGALFAAGTVLAR